MTEDPYSSDVRTLFAKAKHAGTAGGPNAKVARVDAQGVSVELSAEVRHGQLDVVRFRAKGCPHLIAACETLCDQLEGQPAAALKDCDFADIMRRLSVPVEKTGRILVLEDTALLLADRIVSEHGNGAGA